MRIAIFHDLPSGGAKRALLETVKRLVKQHDVDVYSLSSSDHNFCDLRDYVNQYQIFEFQPRRLFQSPFGRINPIQRTRDMITLEKVSTQIADVINHKDYDVVYVQPSIWTQAPVIIRSLEIPTVYYVHEPLRSVYEPRVVNRSYEKQRNYRKFVDNIDPFYKLYWRNLKETDYQATRQASIILANSQFTASNINNIYHRKARVCYLGVDTEVFRPLHLQRDKSVLSVGVLSPHKGFDFIIEALSQIPTSKRPELTLVGNEVDSQEYDFLNQLSNEKDVKTTFLLKVELDTLLYLYNTAALVVYSPVNEPFGLVPLEAMSCGTPVVGVAEGGVPETIVDGITGRLTTRNHIHFAEAVSGMLENHTERTRLGSQAREHVTNNWNWDKTIQQLENIFHEAANMK